MSRYKDSSKQVTISQEEYDALIHTAEVTMEYIQGKKETFQSAEDLIKNLKS